MTNFISINVQFSTFRSESPSQIFMLTIQMIYAEIKNLPENEQDKHIENYVLSYDNV